MSPEEANLTNAIQKLLDDAVARGVAPGLVAAVSNSRETFASACSGVVGVAEGKKDQKFNLDTIVWPASAAKFMVSLIVLIIVEREKFDLDSHEELVKVIPELGKDWPGTRIWKIIDGEDENGEYKYRDAKVGITLRHLLTHSIGSALHFNSESGLKFFSESLEVGPPHMAGNIAAYNEPRMWESGEGWAYGLPAEWLGVFVQRKNGTSFRQAAQELLYEPLGLPKDTIETFRTPPMDENLAEIVAKLPDGSFVSLPTPFDTPQHEGVPPEGQSVLGNAPFWSSIRTFTQALRCLLNKSAPSPGGKPLISEKLFNEAIGDDFKRRGISINQNPFMKSTDNNLSTDIDWWSKPCEGQDETLGWNMLQQCYHRAETPVGFRPDVTEWSGLANTYYAVDREKDLVFVVSTQSLAWGQPDMIKLKNDFFKLVFDYSKEA